MGERLADAHEWEGACQGDLERPDYRFDLARGLSPNAAVERMRAEHNRTDAATKRWSYGPEYRKGICATSSQKTPGCNGGSWTGCGSNTFPAGDFPACHSPLGVYDLNGNAAEHMNLPLNESQMSSRGSQELGYTEMKGSWFVFDTLSRARGLVPLAGTLLARLTRDGRAQPRQLSPGLSLRQRHHVRPREEGRG